MLEMIYIYISVKDAPLLTIVISAIIIVIHYFILKAKVRKNDERRKNAASNAGHDKQP